MNRLVDLAVLRPDTKVRQALAMMMGLLVASCAQYEPVRPKAVPAPSAPPAITRHAEVPAPAQPVPVVPPAKVATPTNEAPLPQLKAKYEAKLRELDRARDKSIADAPAQYRLYLQNLEKQFVDKGDLKGVLAVQNESNRFAKAGAVTTNDLVSTPEGLLVAQRLMLGAPETAERVRLQGRDDLNRAYCAALERLVTSLTQVKRIPEAQAARDEADRICPFVPPAPAVTNVPPTVKRDPTPLPTPQPPKPVAPVLPAGLKNGLLAFYPLNGTGEDVSGNGRSGKVIGATATTNRFGDSASALSFDGIDDLVQVNTSISPKTLTVCLWANVPTDSTKGQLIRCDPYGFGIIPSGRDLSFLVCNSGSYENALTPRASHIVDGRWHHIAFTYGKSGFVIYIDGVRRPESSSRDTGPVFYNHAETRLQIGAYEPMGVFQRGEIDNVGIWSRELSAVEIRQVQALR